MARHYDTLFHEIKSNMLAEISNLMDEQEVAHQTADESSAHRRLCNMRESAGFQSLFDVAHQALHDVYLDGYFDDISRTIVAKAIEKVLGGYHEQRKSSGSKVRTQKNTRREHGVRPKQRKEHHVLSKRSRKLSSLSRAALAKRKSQTGVD